MLLSNRAPNWAGRTFEEVMEQQAARQAGFGESIRLQPVHHSHSTDTFRIHSTKGYHGPPSQLITYPPLTAKSEHRPARPLNAGLAVSSPHLPLQVTSSVDLTASRSTSDSSYRAVQASVPGYTAASSSSSSSVHAFPLTPTSTLYPWSESDWGYPSQASSVAIGSTDTLDKKARGLKGWLSRRVDKAKDRDVSVEVKPVKEDKPIFIGGGRGGVQNRRRVTGTGAIKPSPLVSISECTRTSETLPPPTRPTHSSSDISPVTFTPDIQEALETLTPRPVFVGGGRGGMQNRKMKDLTSSRASGSGKSSTSRSASDGDSSRRSIKSFTSLLAEGSAGSVGSGPQKPVFVGGGRGGVQNRKGRDLGEKKSQAALGGKGEAR